MADIKELYMSATGCTGIISIQAGGDYHGPCQQALIECTGTTLSVGDAVEVDLGYSDDHEVIVHGYVKEINPTVPEGVYRVRVYDELILAVDFLIVSDDPNAPLEYNNIQAEDLVEAVLALATITNYHGDHPGFTFGVNNPVKVQLVKSWDFVRQICHMLAWWSYADKNGRVYFVNRPPYPDGDVSAHTFTKGAGGDLLVVNHTRSDEKTRNKVVVYGYNGISATAQASSPPGVSLPAGFYKAAVIAYPEIIDTQEMAQAAAEYNLTLLNRLTETVTIDALGVPGLVRGQVVTLTMPTMSLSGQWFVYECNHRIDRGGYRVHCTLSK